MCDYSLMHLASRPAKVGDKLVTSSFNGGGSRGFAPAAGPTEAVCVIPGTELSFEDNITTAFGSAMYGVSEQCEHPHRVAIFRQVDKEQAYKHHDVLELPDGAMVYLTNLRPGQRATVLQLPAEPKNEAEVAEQKRAEFV